MNSKFFEREIANITDGAYRDFVRWFFNNKVGAWFFESGASSSGKYHPEFAKGYGGLVRHTRAVAWVCESLLPLNTYAYMSDEYKDYARIACLLHDTCKYGTNTIKDKDCYKEHGKLAAYEVSRAWHEFFNESAPELLLMAIRSHMGQWVEDKDERPFTPIDRLVHLSDYIASRPFWDIYELCDQYDHDCYSEEQLSD